jgi:hypothetical protein
MMKTLFSPLWACNGCDQIVELQSNYIYYGKKLNSRLSRGGDHYYPYGLTMAGISDKALKTGYVENTFRFNKGSEFRIRESVMVVD